MNVRLRNTLWLGLFFCVLSFTSAALAEDQPPAEPAKSNVNTAPSTELVALPGIGPKKAEAIVLYRPAHGPFATVDDLIQVKGIGAKTLEKLRPLVTVGKQKKKKKAQTAPRKERST